MRILLIEDEPKIADFICAGLAERGCEVRHCSDGHRGLELGRGDAFDAIILDVMLPGRDGLSVLKALRAEGVRTPLILLTARNELDDRIRGLELGADDYLAKPFYVEELHARIQTLLRRAGGGSPQVLQVGPLRLDRISREVSCGGQIIELTSREFSLLEYLMRSAGQVYTRQQILEHVWGYDFDPSTNVVDVCVKRVRDKIAAIDGTATSGSAIESVRGVGYRFRRAP